MIYPPQKKLSWKFTIPLLLVVVSLTIAMWLWVPELVQFKAVATVAILVFTLFPIIWSIWGDYE